MNKRPPHPLIAIDGSGSNLMPLSEMVDLVNFYSQLNPVGVTLITFNNQITKLTFLQKFKDPSYDIQLQDTLKFVGIPGGPKIDPVFDFINQSNFSEAYILTDGYFEKPTITPKLSPTWILQEQFDNDETWMKGEKIFFHQGYYLGERLKILKKRMNKEFSISK